MDPEPTFCGKNWCYVDESACSASDLTASDFFGDTLHYSYITCGDEYNFSN